MTIRTIKQTIPVVFALFSILPAAFAADEAQPAPGREVASKHHKGKKKHHKAKKHHK